MTNDEAVDTILAVCRDLEPEAALGMLSAAVMLELERIESSETRVAIIVLMLHNWAEVIPELNITVKSVQSKKEKLQ